MLDSLKVTRESISEMKKITLKIIGKNSVRALLQDNKSSDPCSDEDYKKQLEDQEKSSFPVVRYGPFSFRSSKPEMKDGLRQKKFQKGQHNGISIISKRNLLIAYDRERTTLSRRLAANRNGRKLFHEFSVYIHLSSLERRAKANNIGLVGIETNPGPSYTTEQLKSVMTPVKIMFSLIEKSNVTSRSTLRDSIQIRSIAEAMLNDSNAKKLLRRLVDSSDVMTEIFNRSNSSYESLRNAIEWSYTTMNDMNLNIHTNMFLDVLILFFSNFVIEYAMKYTQYRKSYFLEFSSNFYLSTAMALVDGLELRKYSDEILVKTDLTSLYNAMDPDQNSIIEVRERINVILDESSTSTRQKTLRKVYRKITLDVIPEEKIEDDVDVTSRFLIENPIYIRDDTWDGRIRPEELKKSSEKLEKNPVLKANIDKLIEKIQEIHAEFEFETNIPVNDYMETKFVDIMGQFCEYMDNYQTIEDTIIISLSILKKFENLSLEYHHCPIYTYVLLEMIPNSVSLSEEKYVEIDLIFDEYKKGNKSVLEIDSWGGSIITLDEDDDVVNTIPNVFSDDIGESREQIIASQIVILSVDEMVSNWSDIEPDNEMEKSKLKTLLKKSKYIFDLRHKHELELNGAKTTALLIYVIADLCMTGGTISIALSCVTICLNVLEMLVKYQLAKTEVRPDVLKRILEFHNRIEFGFDLMTLVYKLISGDFTSAAALSMSLFMKLPKEIKINNLLRKLLSRKLVNKASGVSIQKYMTESLHKLAKNKELKTVKRRGIIFDSSGLSTEPVEVLDVTSDASSDEEITVRKRVASEFVKSDNVVHADNFLDYLKVHYYLTYLMWKKAEKELGVEHLVDYVTDSEQELNDANNNNAMNNKFPENETDVSDTESAILRIIESNKTRTTHAFTFNLDMDDELNVKDEEIADSKKRLETFDNEEISDTESMILRIIESNKKLKKGFHAFSFDSDDELKDSTPIQIIRSKINIWFDSEREIEDVESRNISRINYEVDNQILEKKQKEEIEVSDTESTIMRILESKQNATTTHAFTFEFDSDDEKKENLSESKKVPLNKSVKNISFKGDLGEDFSGLFHDSDEELDITKSKNEKPLLDEMLNNFDSELAHALLPAAIRRRNPPREFDEIDERIYWWWIKEREYEPEENRALSSFFNLDGKKQFIFDEHLFVPKEIHSHPSRLLTTMKSIIEEQDFIEKSSPRDSLCIIHSVIRFIKERNFEMNKKYDNATYNVNEGVFLDCKNRFRGRFLDIPDIQDYFHYDIHSYCESNNDLSYLVQMPKREDIFLSYVNPAHYNYYSKLKNTIWVELGGDFFMIDSNCDTNKLLSNWKFATEVLNKRKFLSDFKPDNSLVMNEYLKNNNDIEIVSKLEPEYIFKSVVKEIRSYMTENPNKQPFVDLSAIKLNYNPKFRQSSRLSKTDADYAESIAKIISNGAFNENGSDSIVAVQIKSSKIPKKEDSMKEIDNTDKVSYAGRIMSRSLFDALFGEKGMLNLESNDKKRDDSVEKLHNLSHSVLYSAARKEQKMKEQEISVVTKKLTNKDKSVNISNSKLPQGKCYFNVYNSKLKLEYVYHNVENGKLYNDVNNHCSIYPFPNSKISSLLEFERLANEFIFYSEDWFEMSTKDEEKSHHNDIANLISNAKTIEDLISQINDVDISSKIVTHNEVEMNFAALKEMRQILILLLPVKDKNSLRTTFETILSRLSVLNEHDTQLVINTTHLIYSKHPEWFLNDFDIELFLSNNYNNQSEFTIPSFTPDTNFFSQFDDETYSKRYPVLFNISMVVINELRRHMIDGKNYIKNLFKLCNSNEFRCPKEKTNKIGDDNLIDEINDSTLITSDRKLIELCRNSGINCILSKDFVSKYKFYPESNFLSFSAVRRWKKPVYVDQKSFQALTQGENINDEIFEVKSTGEIKGKLIPKFFPLPDLKRSFEPVKNVKIEKFKKDFSYQSKEDINISEKLKSCCNFNDDTGYKLMSEFFVNRDEIVSMSKNKPFEILSNVVKQGIETNNDAKAMTYIEYKHDIDYCWPSVTKVSGRKDHNDHLFDYKIEENSLFEIFIMKRRAKFMRNTEGQSEMLRSTYENKFIKSKFPLYKKYSTDYNDPSEYKVTHSWDDSKNAHEDFVFNLDVTTDLTLELVGDTARMKTLNSQNTITYFNSDILERFSIMHDHMIHDFSHNYRMKKNILFLNHNNLYNCGYILQSGAPARKMTSQRIVRYFFIISKSNQEYKEYFFPDFTSDVHDDSVLLISRTYVLDLDTVVYRANFYHNTFPLRMLAQTDDCIKYLWTLLFSGTTVKKLSSFFKYYNVISTSSVSKIHNLFKKYLNVHIKKPSHQWLLFKIIDVVKANLEEDKPITVIKNCESLEEMMHLNNFYSFPRSRTVSSKQNYINFYLDIKRNFNVKNSHVTEPQCGEEFSNGLKTCNLPLLKESCSDYKNDIHTNLEDETIDNFMFDEFEGFFNTTTNGCDPYTMKKKKNAVIHFKVMEEFSLINQDKEFNLSEFLDWGLSIAEQRGCYSFVSEKIQKDAADREIYIQDYFCKLAHYPVQTYFKKLDQLWPSELVSASEKQKLERISRMKFDVKSLYINIDMKKWSPQDIKEKFRYVTQFLYDEGVISKKYYELLSRCLQATEKITLLFDERIDRVVDNEDKAKLRKASELCLKDNLMTALSDSKSTAKFYCVEMTFGWPQGLEHFISSFVHGLASLSVKKYVPKLMKDPEMTIYYLFHSDDGNASVNPSFNLDERKQVELLLSFEAVLRQFSLSFSDTKISLSSGGSHLDNKKSRFKQGGRMISELVSVYNVEGTIVNPFLRQAASIMASFNSRSFVDNHLSLISRCMSIFNLSNNILIPENIYAYYVDYLKKRHSVETNCLHSVHIGGLKNVDISLISEYGLFADNISKLEFNPYIQNESEISFSVPFKLDSKTFHKIHEQIMLQDTDTAIHKLKNNTYRKYLRDRLLSINSGVFIPSFSVDLLSTRFRQSGNIFKIKNILETNSEEKSSLSDQKVSLIDVWNATRAQPPNDLNELSVGGQEALEEIAKKVFRNEDITIKDQSEWFSFKGEIRSNSFRVATVIYNEHSEIMNFVNNNDSYRNSYILRSKYNQLLSDLYSFLSKFAIITVEQLAEYQNVWNNLKKIGSIRSNFFMLEKENETDDILIIETKSHFNLIPVDVSNLMNNFKPVMLRLKLTSDRRIRTLESRILNIINKFVLDIADETEFLSEIRLLIRGCTSEELSESLNKHVRRDVVSALISSFSGLVVSQRNGSWRSYLYDQEDTSVINIMINGIPHSLVAKGDTLYCSESNKNLANEMRKKYRYKTLVINESMDQSKFELPEANSIHGNVRFSRIITSRKGDKIAEFISDTQDTSKKVKKILELTLIDEKMVPKNEYIRVSDYVDTVKNLEFSSTVIPKSIAFSKKNQNLPKNPVVPFASKRAEKNSIISIFSNTTIMKELEMCDGNHGLDCLLLRDSNVKQSQAVCRKTLTFNKWSISRLWRSKSIQLYYDELNGKIEEADFIVEREIQREIFGMNPITFMKAQRIFAEICLPVSNDIKSLIETLKIMNGMLETGVLRRVEMNPQVGIKWQINNTGDINLFKPNNDFIASVMKPEPLSAATKVCYLTDKLKKKIYELKETAPQLVTKLDFIDYNHPSWLTFDKLLRGEHLSDEDVEEMFVRLKHLDMTRKKKNTVRAKRAYIEQNFTGFTTWYPAVIVDKLRVMEAMKDHVVILDEEEKFFCVKYTYRSSNESDLHLDKPIERLQPVPVRQSEELKISDFDFNIERAQMVLYQFIRFEANEQGLDPDEATKYQSSGVERGIVPVDYEVLKKLIEENDVESKINWALITKKMDTIQLKKSSSQDSLDMFKKYSEKLSQDDKRKLVLMLYMLDENKTWKNLNLSMDDIILSFMSTLGESEPEISENNNVTFVTGYRRGGLSRLILDDMLAKLTIDFTNKRMIKAATKIIYWFNEKNRKLMPLSNELRIKLNSLIMSINILFICCKPRYRKEVKNIIKEFNDEFFSNFEFDIDLNKETDSMVDYECQKLFGICGIDFQQ
nr:RNA-dependent RNA polymerase [Rhizoctonia zeae bunyavirus 1]